MAPWPSGKAKVCNTSTPGSNPGGASQERWKAFFFYALEYLDQDMNIVSAVWIA